jgi:hypothetical protein
MTDEDKAKVLKKRNRDNAALTRKRQKIYADFLDKAIEELTMLLTQDKDFGNIHDVQELIDGSGLPSKKRMKKNP